MENINTKKKNLKIKIILISLLVIVLAILSFLIFAPKNIESIKDSVVMIEVYDKYNNQISTGSGFCAYKSNYIVTNFHVIEGAYKIKIITDENKEYPINNILIFNEAHDLAILSGDIKLKPISIGNATHLKAGDSVTAIGSPKGELNTVSAGIISNADNDYEIRITAPISPGSSGGVLLNKFNKIIGITYASYNAEDSQNLNYAISVNYLNKMRDGLIKKEYTVLNGDGYVNAEGLTFEEYTNAILDKKETFNDEYYSVNSLVDWYSLTSVDGKLKRLLSEDWYNVYNNLSNEAKQIADDYIVALGSVDLNDIDISQDITGWYSPDFFIYLSILDTNQYSIIAADISLCKDKDEIFDVVDAYPLEAAEKALVLYLIGDYDWSEIHKDNKNDIFDYFDEKYDTDEFGAILEYLGYTVEYENDGTLTAWW